LSARLRPQACDLRKVHVLNVGWSLSPQATFDTSRSSKGFIRVAIPTSDDKQELELQLVDMHSSREELKIYTLYGHFLRLISDTNTLKIQVTYSPTLSGLFCTVINILNLVSSPRLETRRLQTSEFEEPH